MNANNGARTTFPHVWVGYLDGYGFSAATERERPGVLTAAFLALADCLDGARRRVTRTLQFSDSIFVLQEAFPNPLDQFQVFQSVIGAIQSVGLDHGMAFRGSAAFGEVTAGPFGFFGSPIVRAVKLEQELLPPLVVLPQREIRRAERALGEISGRASLGFSPDVAAVATKSGELLGYVLEPPARKYLHHANEALLGALTDGPDRIVPAWRAAIAALNASLEVEA